MDQSALQSIVSELVRRPGHEKVRTDIIALLVDGLHAERSQIELEKKVNLIEVKGRIDALLGRTLIEVKSDLRNERKKGEPQIQSYLEERERSEGQRYVGILTDGAEFTVHIAKDGQLEQIGEYKPSIDNPDALLSWLESVVVLSDEIPPDVHSIRTELGRDSVAYARSLREISDIWNRIQRDPSVEAQASLKRDLWNRLLRVAYGSDVAEPTLFFQHTYLTIVAKSIATVAMMDMLPLRGRDLLEGKPFRDRGILGVVESDFFDWILLDESGERLVLEIARHANRFKLRDIEADILKGLYESLIDPAQRRELGEFYTPDWLAYRMCKAAITAPLEQRIIDPACGSGTFLFHAARHLFAATEKAGLAPEAAVRLAIEKIAGIEVHPVAVIFARVTFLLALMPMLQRGRPPTLALPIYLGDALQWNRRELMHLEDLEIIVPAEKEAVTAALTGKLPDEDDSKRIILRFPTSVAADPGVFDDVLGEMLNLAERNQPASAFEGWLKRNNISNNSDIQTLLKTFEDLKLLRKEGRNHIWGYVARNLSRPIWLATDAQKANVVLGNPPWLAYTKMNNVFQRRFKEEMRAAGLWDSKADGAMFDLSAYFFARTVHYYMRREGHIAFVMPYAAMTRKAYGPFRKGKFKERGSTEAIVKFTEAWAFPSDRNTYRVSPLFPVPSCVLFAERSAVPQPLPQTVHIYSGDLPRRDASPQEAAKALKMTLTDWPREQGGKPSSPYAKKFKAGAKLDPRRFVLVERVTEGGRLAASAAVPLVKGRVGAQDKKPWRDLPAPQHAVERDFIMRVLLGESIGPYRVFSSVEAIIPWSNEDKILLDSSAASARGYSRLAEWLTDIENLWNTYGKKKTTFQEKINFRHLLSSQFPVQPLRVVYAKSGTNLTATIIRDTKTIFDHKLYWTAVDNEDEAFYLAAIMNSETTREGAAEWQSEGQYGKRDFDKAAFNLQIPKFNAANLTHRNLADAARRAQGIAESVELPEGRYFTTLRKKIRDAITDVGLAATIDALVAELLKGDT